VDETEIKLRVSSPEAARAALGRLGVASVRARHFEDNLLFDDAQGSLRARGCIVRLRRTEGHATLTYKGARRVVEGVRSREERETRVDDADVLQLVLETVGLKASFRYQKYRESYEWRGVEIVVDETPIGSFLEIEGELARIHAAAAALGYTPADYIADSYAALFFASGRSGDMVFTK
jgi:adenylate cyclase class 2